jgi:hypothetical protein
MKLSDLLLSGPGHDGYSYNADVYCVACGQDIIRERYPHVKGDEDAQRDSESCPQPIFFGESDHAEHCGGCGEYLYGPQEEEADESEEDDRHEPIPADFPVQPLSARQACECPTAAICGHCGLSWDDGKITSLTPAPGGRCPFESFHLYDE